MISCVSFFVFAIVLLILFFFFFQAEDGIRDYKVTGVQTCALPIFTRPRSRPRAARPERNRLHRRRATPQRSASAPRANYPRSKNPCPRTHAGRCFFRSRKAQ